VNPLTIVFAVLFMAVSTVPTAQAAEDFRYCLVCHGTDLHGNDTVGGANLNILPDWYVARQLKGFRQGWRGMNRQDKIAQEMMAVAVAMEPDAIAKAATFVADTPARRERPATDFSDARAQAETSLCETCHGERLQGNQSTGAPPLAGQSAAYLLRQLIAFRSGSRGHQPDDSYGQQMRAIALGLNETELPNLVQTLQNLPVSTQPLKENHE
jgi:cytochrome c oxidase subunit 2